MRPLAADQDSHGSSADFIDAAELLQPPASRAALGRHLRRVPRQHPARAIPRRSRAAATNTSGTCCAGTAAPRSRTRRRTCARASCSSASCSASTSRCRASSTTSRPRPPARTSAAGCCCCSGRRRAASRPLAILLKRGLEEYSRTDEGALYAIKGSPLRENPLNLIPTSLRPEFRERYGVDIQGELSPWARDFVEREFEGDFVRVPVERVFLVGSLAHRHRHLRAARSDHRRHRRPGRLGRSRQGRADRRRGRPARLVVVGRRLRRQPRHARDDRDPEGEARVPLPAAHPDAGEERQGVALPAHPPRRDHPRAHQPRRVPQVPAGEGERGAARPHGDHQGPVRALLSRRGAHLPEAGLRRAGVPQRAPRSARAESRGGVRHPDAPRRSPSAKGWIWRRSCASMPARRSRACRRPRRRGCKRRGRPTRA